MTNSQKQAQQEAIESLKKILKPGDSVHGIVRSVSKSGMSRRIDFYKLTDKGEQFLTGYFALAIDGKWNGNSGGLRVNGCGMDMIFHTVYTIGRILWPEGDGKTVTGRNGDKKPETDGGYLLKSRQL